MDNDNDDFEFVDNDKYDEDSDNDDMLKISDINKELKEVNELKKYLKNQSIECSKLVKKLKEESNEYNKLNNNLRDELKQVHELRASLKKDKDEFSKLLSSMSSIPSNISKSNNLLNQLNKFYNDTSYIEQEAEKLKLLRQQQQETINQCKIYIEQINSNQRDCLISLDKSVSFSCKECGTDIALKDDIESKCYQVGQGQFTEKKRGYLFSNGVNMILGNTKTENFTTGSYQIAWTSCAKCNTQMGWKYISADNPNNTAKVGKYCLARYSLTSPEDRAQK